MKTTMIVMLAVVWLAPSGAWAQTDSGPPAISRSFEQLRLSGLLEEDDTVWIFADLFGTGEVAELKASFETLAGTTVSVSVDDLPDGGTDLATSPADGRHRIVLPETRVRRIDAEYADPLTNGIVIGALVGFSIVAVPVVIYLTTCEGFCFGPGAGGLIAGVGAAGAGAVIGFSFDAAIKSRRAVYASPGVSGAGVSVSVSPIITRGRKGFLFALDW